MLANEFIEITINQRNRNRFSKDGNNYKNGDKILLHYTEVPLNSSYLANVECDYCNKKYLLRYCDYIKAINRSVVKNIACRDCMYVKARECNLLNYGVESVLSLKEVKEKRKKTNLQKYGVECVFQNEDIRDKQKATVFSKYGVYNVFQNKEVQEKQKQTVLDKYGVENVFQNEDVKIKIAKTMMEKYNVKNPMQSAEIKKVAISNLLKSRYLHNSAPCSKQQRYLHNLLGGELNYPVNHFYLDIAFTKEKIYIEYDGKGHDLTVKLNLMTEKDFHKKELDRYFILKRLGWKQIVIQSSEDLLPCDDIIVELINKNKEILLNSEDHNRIVININNDDNLYGKLRKIKLPQIKNK